MENAGSKGRLPGRSGGKLKVTIELSIWALKTPSHAFIDLNCCRSDIFVLAFLQKIRQYGVLEGEKESQEKVGFSIRPPKEQNYKTNSSKSFKYVRLASDDQSRSAHNWRRRWPRGLG
jgi:hypothetical protein